MLDAGAGDTFGIEPAVQPPHNRNYALRKND